MLSKHHSLDSFYIYHDAWLDKDGNPLSCEDEIYSNFRLPSGGMTVKFKKNLILDGVFSVADGKTVQFTRGNLCYVNRAPEIEQHQYDFNLCNGQKKKPMFPTSCGAKYSILRQSRLMILHG